MQHHNNLNKQIQNKLLQQNQPLSDKQFYQNLKHYQPIFYSGTGTPFLMINKNWQNSFNCVACLDLISIVSYIFYAIKINKNQIKTSTSDISPILTMLLSIVMLFLTHISLFLTQLMNPGIKNLSVITQLQFNKQGKIYCKYCKLNVTKQMVHCRQCDVCIWGLDHHCGFFNKCIGGYQKWAFFMTLTFGFLAFVSLIVILGSLVI